MKKVMKQFLLTLVLGIAVVFCLYGTVLAGTMNLPKAVDIGPIKGGTSMPFIAPNLGDAQNICAAESQKHSNLTCTAQQDETTKDAKGMPVLNFHCECK